MKAKIKSWTLIEEVKVKNKKKYKIQCDCGKIRVVDKYDYENIGNTKESHLGDMCKQCAKVHRWENADPVHKLYRLIHMDYKRQASRRDLIFTLTSIESYNLFTSNCHYCNSEPNNVKKHGKNKNVFFNYQGIDRIDPKVGYINSNCVACCKHCNYAKREMSYNEFIDWIKLVYLYRVQRSERKLVGPSGSKQELS